MWRWEIVTGPRSPRMLYGWVEIWTRILQDTGVQTIQGLPNSFIAGQECWKVWPHFLCALTSRREGSQTLYLCPLSPVPTHFPFCLSFLHLLSLLDSIYPFLLILLFFNSSFVLSPFLLPPPSAFHPSSLLCSGGCFYGLLRDHWQLSFGSICHQVHASANDITGCHAELQLIGGVSSSVWWDWLQLVRCYTILERWWWWYKDYGKCFKWRKNHKFWFTLN